ncbi:S-layer family protein [Pseudanabaena sp. UWO311]|uniref:beta strand repeat-containing protein n=1 Tax=Pseudanabaena sp. UWO311 TaxID=2487337 RepID=UPI00115A1639|nr:S-layer family protein [Pseudanabaena sp. UWO311]TYQ28626.1 S-layer family protein [Pseudanabaena sp. UWO311]
MTFTGGAQIQTQTWSTGNAGAVTINATDSVSFSGRSPFGFPTLIDANNDGGFSGNAASININAKSLSVTDGALLIAATQGGGNAGSININVTDSVLFSGINGFNRLSSSAFTSVFLNRIGNSGDININAKSVTIENGAQLNASIYGTGSAGNIKINASDRVLFSGANSIAATNVGGSVFPGGGLTAQPVGSIGNTGTAIGNGGNIFINAPSVSVTDGAQLQAFTFGTGNAGNISITAADSVLFSGRDNNGNLSGTYSMVGFINVPTAIGNGGNVNVNANSLAVLNGAQLLASTFGTGNAGNININAANSVLLAGTNTAAISSVGSSNAPIGIGNGGNVNIKANTINVKDGAQLQTSTFGIGNAGSINISAIDSVVFSGANTLTNSTVGSPNVLTTKGNGGNINVNANSLSVTDGAVLINSTWGQGNAGNITINATDSILLSGSGNEFNGISSFVNPSAIGNGGNVNITTKTLTMLNGSQISTSTASSGNAGSINLFLTQSLMLDGVGTSINAATANLPSSTGNGGSIFIDPQNVTLQNGAGIFTSSFGSGIGGNITIFSNNLSLYNSSFLKAETASANGGNINLNIPALLLLRYASRISTTAGNSLAGGNGGNININAGFIIGIKDENSDIFANAFTGNGGNININTNIIFGLKFRPKLTPFSDIVASSQFGLQGSVLVTTPGLDPSRGLTTLPLNLADPSKQVNQSCVIGGKLANRNNSFTISGKGGVPKSPSDGVSSTQSLVELSDPVASSISQATKTEQKPEMTPETPTRLVEANTIVRRNGNLELVLASAPLSPAIPQLACQ